MGFRGSAVREGGPGMTERRHRVAAALTTCSGHGATRRSTKWIATFGTEIDRQLVDAPAARQTPTSVVTSLKRVVSYK